VNDGYLESLVANTTIGIIPVNDAPVIMGPLATAIYTWGEVPICAVPTVSVTDADDELIESGLIEISTGLQSGDVLTSTYAGANITALVTSGKIVLTGPASLAEFEAYLTALQFSTTAAAGIRVLSITLNDGDDDSNIYSRIISVDVPAVNDDPVALDDTYEVDEYVVLTIGNEAGMMRNDIDPDGDVISVQSVDHATYGTLIWNANGSFTYTQNIGNAELGVGESLVETLSYTINDGNGAIATANVTIVINGVNDMPTAMTDNVSVNENESVAMGTNHGLLSNDTDPNAGDDIRITSVNGTSNARNTGSYGELIWSALGDFTYTPDNSIDAVNQMKATDYLVETFRYMMSDGNGGKATADLVITIFGQNDAPVVADDVAEVEEGATLNGASLLLNDMDPDGDDLIISTFPLEEPLNGALDIHSDGTYTYKPNAYFFGTDTFTYEVCDDNNPQACATAQVVITVNQVELDNFEVLEGYSPNGDGVNDKFTIDWLYRFEKVSFEIFNRWGNVVYRQDRYDNNWNGYSNVGLTIGKELPVGTYYYVINIKDIGVSLNGYIYLNR